MNDKPSSLAANVRDTLLNQQALLKKASAERDEALQNSANLEGQMRVLSDVIDLVAKGVIDPTDAPSKVAEFLHDPMSLEILKQAYLMGYDQVPRLGSPQPSEVPASSASAEAALAAAIQNLVGK